MTVSARIAKNTLFLVVARIVSPLFSLYLIVSIARHMGAEGLGAYSFVYNLLLVFQIISAFGLENFIAREVARAPLEASKYFSNVVLVGILLGLGLQMAMLATGRLMGQGGEVWQAITIVSFSLYASSMIGCFEGILTGLERIHMIAVSQMIETFTRVSVSLILVYQGYGLVELMWVVLFSRLLALGLMSLFTFRQLHVLKFSLDPGFIKELLMEGRTFALIMIAVTLYWKLDIIMLQKLRGEADVGIYSAAYRIFLLLKILPQSFVTSLFPMISNFFQNSTASFEETCRRGIRYIALFSLPIAVGVSLSSPWIIRLLYTESFSDSVTVLRILAWTIVPYGVSVVFAYSLVASNHQQVDLRVNLFSLLSNAALNLILIPKLAYVGAAIATFTSSLIYLLLQYPFVRRNLYSPQLLVSIRKPAMAAAAAGGISLLLYRPLGFYPALMVSPFVYVVLLILFRTFTENERNLVFFLLGRFLNVRSLPSGRS